MHVVLVLDKALSFRGQGHSLDRIFPGACAQFMIRGLFTKPLLGRHVSLKNPTPFFVTSAVYIPLYDVILSTVALHIYNRYIFYGH